MRAGSLFSVGEDPRNGSFLLAACGKCKLSLKCSSPRMRPTGEGRKKTLVIAQSPGREEDKEGSQLVGPSGKLVRQTLSRFGVDLDRDCWKDNAVRCFPGHTEVTDRHVSFCKPNIISTIEELKPERIILFGGEAVQSVIGHYWKEGDVGSVSRWAGWKIPCCRLNCWICPTYHPSWLLRSPDPAKELWFSRHLEEAFSLSGRPWPDGPPNFGESVECIYSPSEAAKALREMMRVEGGLYSIDFECDRLKPDHPEASIVSCAICKDGKAISFPWCGEVVEEVGRFCFSKLPKIGYNIKYETRWSKRIFGHGVRNWIWDGMIGAHVLDSRSGVTSLKFQAFVLFGVDNWDSVVGGYFDCKGGNDKNRIRECDLRDVLFYNGLDAVLTYLVGRKQMELLGVSF